MDSEMKSILLKEQYGTEDVKNVYIKTPESKVEIERTGRWTSLWQGFKNVFLPQGYPESVSEDYLTYQAWDTVQAFCSSITGALAAQAVLKGVGVGDEKATVLAATMTWLIKDGTGMLGRILFAWMKGNYLDCDCKRWRLFADILNDCAICMEILAPAFPAAFLAIVCTSGVFKSIVGVAGGATRAALTQHQARRNNLADVSAKDGSQETLVNLAAWLCNLALVPVVSENQYLIWTLFTVFTFLHLFANYRAVTSVTMSTLNQARLHIIMEEYFETGNVPGIKQTNRREPVILPTLWELSCQLGCSAKEVVKVPEAFSSLKRLYGASANYLLAFDQKSKTVRVVFNEKAKAIDFLQAAVHFELLDHAVIHRGRILDGPSMSCTHFRNLVEAARYDDYADKLLAPSYKWVKTHFKKLCDDLKLTGWELDHVMFHVDEWRAEWKLGDFYQKSYTILERPKDE